MANGWYTTTELEQFGIGQRLAYTWFELLEKAEVARRAPGGKHGILLFRPEARDFLLARKNRTGKPRGEPTGWERTILAATNREEWPLEKLALALTVSPTVARGWFESFIAEGKGKDDEACPSCS